MIKKFFLLAIILIGIFAYCNRTTIPQFSEEEMRMICIEEGLY